MKYITLKELPKSIDEEVFNILVEMAEEFPKNTFDWRDISTHLSENDLPILIKILDKVDERKKALDKAKEDAKSEEQKKVEENQKQEFFKNLDPAKFYGNMGEPETSQQYKGKYGVWPPGYDEHGNKIN